MSIVDMAEEEARMRNAKIAAVHLRLGLLSGVVKDALLSCYGMACTGTPLEGSELLIEEVPVEIFCSACQTGRVLSSAQWFCCPECGTPSAAVVHGKELEVSALEIEQ
ncbi:MAG TPA: hydrogenase maturation nickel metallochaperone HypA [Candidatus Angelobacter sp.]|nr:hydrogenase maturation nickel metallochaperone HypA [Candidatus Angelobacter sp.]